MQVLSWQYEGAERDLEGDDELSNAQLGNVGCTLKHDIFGLCTHLDDSEGVSTGSFRVIVHSDGSVKELTKGHFQVMKAAPIPPTVDDSPQSSGSPSDIRKDDEKTNAQKINKFAGNTQEARNEVAGDNELPKPANDTSTSVTEGSEASNGDAGANNVASNDGDKNEDPRPDQPPPPPGNEVPPVPPDEDSPIFKCVVEEMTKQHGKYGLDPEELGLVWYKSLVMMDTSGVKFPTERGVESECGDGHSVRVTQCIRDRTTGYFFIVLGIYKPLLGFIIDRNDGLMVDSDGAQHTLQTAKSSRMLGGNTGYFAGDEESIILCLHNKQKFGMVWISCLRAELPKIFDISPPVEDAKHVFDEDLQKYAQTAVRDFKDAWHSDHTANADGATVLKEDLLRGPNHFRTDYKRRKPKPYLTQSEEAEAAKAKAAQKAADKKAKAAAKEADDKAKAAAKAAKQQAKKQQQSTARKAETGKRKLRSIRVDSSEDESADNGGADEELNAGKSSPKSPRPPSTKRGHTAEQPPQPAARGTDTAPKANPPMSSNAHPKKPVHQPQQPARELPQSDAAFPQPKFDVEHPATAPFTPGNGASAGQPQQQQKPASQQQQQLPVHADLAGMLAQQQQQPNGINSNPVLPHSAVAAQDARQPLHAVNPGAAQAQHMANTQYMSQQQQCINPHAHIHGVFSPPDANAMHMQHAFQHNGFAAPLFTNPFGFHVPQFHGMQPMMQAAAYHTFLVQQASLSAAAAPPPQSANTSAQSASYGSPSLAAIKARIVYESKREKDLQDAQAMHEYWQEKLGMK